jgi:IPT/TIG domain
MEGRMTQQVCLNAKNRSRRFAFAVLLIVSLATTFGVALIPTVAQQGAHVSAVDPTSGKVNDSVTASGALLTKSSVSGIFLSDDKNDYKAIIVSQDADKIVFKIPQVKAGDYNVSIQVGGNLLIQPVKFTVQE